MKYKDHKDFTVQDYKEMQLAQNDFVAMLLYQYLVVKIELKANGTVYKKKESIILSTTILK